MRILFYFNLIAVVIIAGALARSLEGTPLPAMFQRGHGAETPSALPTPVLRADSKLPDFVPQPNPKFLNAEPAANPTDLESKAAPLRVLTEGAYPPFNGRNAKGELVGYDVDMARALCKALARPCDIETRAWKDLLPALTRHDADMVVASMLIPSSARRTVGRESAIAFSTPYYSTPGHFAARRAARLSGGAAALSGKRIAVQTGSIHEAFLKMRFPKADVTSLPNFDAAFDAMADGKADLVFADRNALLMRFEATPNSCCHLVGSDYPDPAYFGRGAGIAMRAGDTKLVADINRTLAAFARDGTASKIARRYFGQTIW